MKPKRSTKAFEQSLTSRQKLVLRLYIAGSSERSMRAVQNAKQICNEHFRDAYELEVVDVFQQPALAKEDHVLAVPTLIKRTPPVRRIIGDLSDHASVLAGLHIKVKRSP